MPRGRFLVFEGLDGSGKSTLMNALGKHLESQGVSVLMTREPGGSPLGEELRRLFIQPELKMSAWAELFCLLAARNQHVSTVIQPALKRGLWVLCDRFSLSTLAYQVHGRGLPRDSVLKADAWARQGLQPDLLIFLTVAPELAQKRRLARINEKPSDRMEQEAEQDHHFFENVHQGYLKEVKLLKKVLKLDNSNSTDETLRCLIQSPLWKALT